MIIRESQRRGSFIPLACARRHAQPIRGLAAIFLLAAVLGLMPGCASFKRERAKVDNSYRKTVNSFSITYFLVPPSMALRWYYNPPFGKYAATYAK